MTRTTVERLIVNVQRPGGGWSRQWLGTVPAARVWNVRRRLPPISHGRSVQNGAQEPSVTNAPGLSALHPPQRAGRGRGPSESLGREPEWTGPFVRPPVDQERLLLPLRARHTNRTRSPRPRRSRCSRQEQRRALLQRSLRVGVDHRSSAPGIALKRALSPALGRMGGRRPGAASVSLVQHLPS